MISVVLAKQAPENKINSRPNKKQVRCFIADESDVRFCFHKCTQSVNQNEKKLLDIQATSRLSAVDPEIKTCSKIFFTLLKLIAGIVRSSALPSKQRPAPRVCRCACADGVSMTQHGNVCGTSFSSVLLIVIAATRTRNQSTLISSEPEWDEAPHSTAKTMPSNKAFALAQRRNLDEPETLSHACPTCFHYASITFGLRRPDATHLSKIGKQPKTGKNGEAAKQQNLRVPFTQWCSSSVSHFPLPGCLACVGAFFFLSSLTYDHPLV